MTTSELPALEARASHLPHGPVSVLARQPIFDRALRINAYELLYRTPGATQANFTDPAMATAQVVVGATLDIGFAHLVGRHAAYINFPAQILTSRLNPPLQPERVVVEVLEGALPDAALIASLQQLRALGYKIALDDYDVRAHSPRLLRHADIVKVDIRQHSPADLPDAVRALRRHPVLLVAEKIETREELSRCRSMGFDLFQGYFLQRPELVQARRVSSARMAVLELITKLSDPEVQIGDLERTICRDVGLSHRILRSINSSYFGLPQEVNSIGQAIVLLGLVELQKLCWLMLVAGLEGQSAYVCVQSLHRARMCEAMCHAAGLRQTELYFMTGMLSTLDVLLQQTMKEAISALPLSSEVRDALLLRRGELGEALLCVESLERGVWDHVMFRDLAMYQIMHAYVHSAQWADGTWGRFCGD